VPDIDRLRVPWTGGSVVGPAVSTFYFTSGGTGYPLAVKNFFDSVKSYFPNTLTWSVPNNGDSLDPLTGDLKGAWTNGTAATVQGTAVNQTVGGTGCRVVWNTAGIHKGRRVRGSTFLCPADGTLFDVNGTINNSALITIGLGAKFLIDDTSSELVVWSKPTKGAADGAANVVISSTVPDKVSWLRSRRT
jgi:hypothetical protein